MEALIVGVATALLSAMATDGWNKARSAIAGLWRKARPDQEQGVERKLEEIRQDLRDRGAYAEKEGMAAIESRLQQLLEGEPDLQGELQRVLDEQLMPLLPDARREQVQQIVQNVQTYDQSTAYVVAHDMYLGAGSRSRPGTPS